MAITYPALRSARHSLALMRQHQYILAQCLRNTQPGTQRHHAVLIKLAKARQLDRRAQAALRNLENLMMQQKRSGTNGQHGEQSLDVLSNILMLSDRSTTLSELGQDIA